MKKVMIMFISLILIVPASGQLKLMQVDPADIGKSWNDYPAYMDCMTGGGGDLSIIPVESHQDSKWQVYIVGEPPFSNLCVTTWRFVPKDPPGALNVKVADVYMGAGHFDVVVDYGYYTRIITNPGGMANGAWPKAQVLFDVGETLPWFPIKVGTVSSRPGYEFLWLSGTAVDLGFAWNEPTSSPTHEWVVLDYDYFTGASEQCYIKGVFGLPIEPGVGPSDDLLPPPLVGLEFDEITFAGHVILDYIPIPELPSGFLLGGSGAFFDITTTADFSGLVEVAVDYSNMDFTVPEDMLQLLHYNGSWSDCTTNIDTLNDIIYGSVSSLSTFAVVQNSSPQVLVEQVIAQVESLDLEQGIENSLNSKLESALKVLDDFNDNNDVAAINSLESFINAVEAQRGKKISEEDADALIEAALDIIELLTNG